MLDLPTWILVRDFIFVAILLGLIYLLWKQISFLEKRVRALLETEQVFQTRATAVSTYIDNFIALFGELKPEKLVERVKATHELVERHAEAVIAEVQREFNEQFSIEVQRREVLESRATKLSEDLLEALALLSLALYHLPPSRREVLTNLHPDDRYRRALIRIVESAKEQFGPSPIERLVTDLEAASRPKEIQAPHNEAS